jgi:hypothetical protein
VYRPWQVPISHAQNAGGFMNADCPACQSKRRHTAEEFAEFHECGHGKTKEQGWTKEGMEPKD